MTRRALLVGINSYAGCNDLHGCVNDITAVADVLVTSLGFDPGDIATLSDQQATRQGIVEGLNALIGKAGRGDLLVFYYSGYGSRVKDTTAPDQASRLEEVLCPHDFDWNGTSIRDEAFAEAIQSMPRGAWLEVFLDACYSGTGGREMILDRKGLAAMGPGPITEEALWSSDYCIRPRFLPPPAEMALSPETEDGRPVLVKRLGAAAVELNVVWEACRETQYSADAVVDGKPAGAFTYFFCKHLRETGGNLTREELLHRIRDSLRREGFSQVPQLECGGDLKKAPVFG